MYDYLDKTPDYLLNEMLEEANPSIDKRQGSVLYDALAPFSIVLAKLYYDLSISYDRFDYRTSYGAYLDLLAAQAPFGLERYPAGCSKRNVTFMGTVPPEGAKFFSNDSLVWVLCIDKNDNSNYVMCETAGEIGNDTENGSIIIPLNNYPNLENAIIGDVVIPGYEQEDDKSLRQRINEKITKPIQDGNKYQYEQWAKEYPGIGGIKITPQWAGLNTIKIVVIDSIGEPASDKLVEDFQNYLDPGSTGMGEGVAPFGAIITVASAIAVKVNISFTLINKSDYTVSEIRSNIEKSLSQYFRKLSFQENIVRLSRIGSLILGIDEAIDYDDLKINGVSGNLHLNNDYVPVKGDLTIIETK